MARNDELKSTTYPNLKKERIIRNLSQTEIAMILGISQRAYSHYECGERKIPLEIWLKLSKYFNQSIEYLSERKNLNEID